MVYPVCELGEVDSSLTLGDASVDLQIPHSLLPFGEKQRQSFLAALPTVAGQCLSAELFLRFFDHVSKSHESENRHDLIQFLWTYFENKILGPTTNIHTFACTQLLGQDARQRKIINSYFSAYRVAGAPELQNRSALFDAQVSGQAKIVGLFGGQGNNKNYFDEIRAIWETYEPLIHDLVATLSNILETLSLEKRVEEQYPQGLDVMGWLTNPESTPDANYLISAPVSFPLIGLLQLAHFKAIGKSLGSESFSALFMGLNGHSQGIIVAAALSTVSDWPSFVQAAVKAVTILFWIGSRCQQVFRQDALSEELAQQLKAEGHCRVSPMLSVSNIRQHQIQRAVGAINRHLPSGKHAHLALINSVSNFVVSGPERTLAALVKSLQAVSAPDVHSQSRVPFSQRKPVPTVRFLPITIPCHSPLLAEAVPLVEGDLGCACSIRADTLKIPVSPILGNINGDVDLTPQLIRMVTSKQVNWLESDFKGATCVLDFGPGLTNGVGSVTHRNVAGAGTHIIVTGKLGNADQGSELGSLNELFSPEKQISGTKWADYCASLIRTPSGTMIKSKFSRLLGLPPIMVGGMTPTTTRPEFVAAVINAGYHVEFAAGGYHSPESLKTALYQLRDMIPPGRGITLNVLYVAPKALAWQVPLIRQLRAEGFPLMGMTVGGGVPSLEVACEYITVLGLEHISFKPSSAASICQVIEIARMNPQFPVILQWTGGRGGGHHSAEDMHGPILEKYAEIRSCGNIILVAGSGFGCAEDVIPYFTGSWGLSHGRASPMPFDAILVGSRVMVCAEAFTSPGAKQAIVAASGVEDKAWERTYRGAAGGVISVVSEMGQPIHVIATRGANLWAEMDKLVFSLDKKKRREVLEANRGHIISRLNADFQRPWFGQKDGMPCDVSEMTYEEVVRRLVRLVYINGRRWIHRSHAHLLYRFLLRVEGRFRQEDDLQAIATETDCLDRPTSVIESVLRACSQASSTVLALEDVDYFVQLCRQPSQKPVPFIPALDDHFEAWFKKDSLWQSEDLDAVIDQDAGRTFILHGPVAARHTCRVDEPVNKILDGINQGVLSYLSGIGATNLPPYEEVMSWSIPIFETTPASQGEPIQVSGLSGEQLRSLILQTGCSSAWKLALFASSFVSRGHSLVKSPFLEVVDSVSADSVQILDDLVSLFSTRNGENQPLVEISKHNSEIQLQVYTYVTSDKSISLSLKFEYRPEFPYAPIQEIMGHRNERICHMYRQLWQVPDPSSCKGTYTVNAAHVQAFNRAIGYKAHQRVPMDFAIAVCWSPICAALLRDPVQGDVLNLVHLSNAYELGEDGPIQIGDVLDIKEHVSAITIEDSGKVVEIACEVQRAGCRIMTVRSKFLFRGDYSDISSTFSQSVEPLFELDITSETDIALLASKPWFRLDGRNTLDYLNLTELTLEFHLETWTTWLSRFVYATIHTKGSVYIRSETGDLTRVGAVTHRAADCSENIVLSYLSRWGRIVNRQQKHPLRGSGSSPEKSYKVQIPASNEAYSRASGDFNPIHTSPVFARLAGLPGTITHGMHSSAAVRQVVEKYTGQNPDRIRRYDVSFTGMVLPGDTLSVSLSHTGMQAGLQVIDITAFNNRTGDKALVGSALVAQPSTTVVFAGQGSQKQGMGMQLYASSPFARAIWDRAEAYFESQFGLSILNIVRHNPKEIKVHFGGVRGRMLRQNYLAMSYYESVPSDEGPRLDRRPIFPCITQASTSYIHSSPNGLLFSTQFAQPALTIMEMAAARDIEARGVVDPNYHFAGHSLGEYAALVSTTGLMSFQNLLYTVFCRGMTMQSVVDRDEHGRSAFAMAAVDPSRVSKDFSDSALRSLVLAIQAQTGFFIEVVNLNIYNQQYVCAGDLRALDLLQRICDAIETSPTPDFTDLIAGYNTYTEDPQEVTLRRGTATVPLLGVDVPFHSSFLRPRMEAFRRVLEDSLAPERVRPQRLVGKYIPNLTGRPFQITKEYFGDTYEATGSKRLGEVLEQWERWEERICREREQILSC